MQDGRVYVGLGLGGSASGSTKITLRLIDNGNLIRETRHVQYSGPRVVDRRDRETNAKPGRRTLGLGVFDLVQPSVL